MLAETERQNQQPVTIPKNDPLRHVKYPARIFHRIRAHLRTMQKSGFGMPLQKETFGSIRLLQSRRHRTHPAGGQRPQRQNRDHPSGFRPRCHRPRPSGQKAQTALRKRRYGQRRDGCHSRRSQREGEGVSGRAGVYGQAFRRLIDSNKKNIATRRIRGSKSGK